MNWTAWTREQRLSIITLALCLGALPLTGLLAWIVYVLAYHWTGFDASRLELLGRIALYLTSLLFVVEIALAMVLSVRAFKGSASVSGGINVDVTGGGDGPANNLINAGQALADAGVGLKAQPDPAAPAG